MNDKFVNYQELELIIDKESNKQTKSGFGSKLRGIWNGIVDSIATVSEPRIYPRNSDGVEYWEIYDPFLGRRVFFDSEAEVRTWLDSRYYQ